MKNQYYWYFLLLEWVTCQLAWKVGNGLKIKVGVDPIAGYNSQYLLSEELIEYLNDLGISYLAQAQNLDVGGSEGSNWYSAADMYLGGEWDV